MDGVEVSPAPISTVTATVWGVGEPWQHRPVAAIYPSVSRDAIQLKLRRDGNGLNRAVSVVLGGELEGQRDVLGQWVGHGAEGANCWLSGVTDRQARGVQDSCSAWVDGLTGFKAAIQAVVPHTHLQRGVIQQVRHSLSSGTWKDRKACVADRKTIYQAPTREAAATNRLKLGAKWGRQYAIAGRSWATNGEALATLVDDPPDIRRLIDTTNRVEGSNRQRRKVPNTKAAFPTGAAARKLLFLINRDSTRKWTMPVHTWACILNQLAIRFEDRFAV